MGTGRRHRLGLWKDGAMARFKVGDKVIITEGDFKGERGAIVDKKLLGDGLVVALEKNGKEIKTHEAHVNLADGD
jgi:transcription antitermination factor NusG